MFETMKATGPWPFSLAKRGSSSMTPSLAVLTLTIAAMTGLSLLTACAGSPAHAAPAEPFACLWPAEQPMLVAELFFGRSVKGRAPVSDTEWAQFAAQTVTPNFPDGFTILDGDGQWRNPDTGQIVSAPTKILVVAAARTPDFAQRLSVVIDAYRRRFTQQSVGLITRDSCAAF